MSTSQSPAFVAAVQTYCQAYQSGIRDMRRLKPLVKRIDAAFCWQPSPPRAPLTEAEKQDTIKTWKQLDAAHDGKITEIAEELIKMPKEQCARTLAWWIAVMDVMQSTPETAPLAD